MFGMPITERRRQWRDLPESVVMTTAEAAGYLGVPNALFVVQHDFPEPPFDGYARPLTPMKRVVWSILGDSRSGRSDIDEVIGLAERFPNITAGIMDDFFNNPNQEGPVARFTLEQTREFGDRLHNAARKLDLWVVIYAHQLDLPSEEYLELCDVVTFWSWWGRELPQLEENLDRLEQRAGDKPKMLGCYFTDPGGQQRLPLDLMKHQCELGLKWLKQGRLDGIIFLGNPICGMGMETVEWTREWIAKVADEELPA
jgi:hypothetical protein